MPLKIVFMGTPMFSLSALELLIKNKFKILCVYTQSPKKSNRGQKINISAVQEFSDKKKLLFRNPENLNSEKEFNFFKELSADLVVVVAYGKIIPKRFLENSRYGFFSTTPFPNHPAACRYVLYCAVKP